MLAIGVLGPLVIEIDGTRAAPPQRRPARLLLGYLALRRGPHARGDLATLLWPDVLQSSARASLRSALAACRRSLGADADRYLLRERDTIGLAGPDLVSVDIEMFDAFVADGRLGEALELTRGPVLQGLDEDFVQQQRAEHVARVSDVLGELASCEEERGNLEDAIRYTRRQVALSSLAEPPNRDLIRRLAATGDRASALAVYADLAERLRRELRTVPSTETRRLADEVRSGVGARSRQTGPLPPHPALRSGLPERFVNRLAELSLLARALARASVGERQVVLVSGPPGIGKTALTARIAESAAASATVLVGRCRENPSAPLEPFVDALRHYAASAPVERLQRELPAAAAELSTLIPEISERVVGPPLPPDLLADGGRLSRAVVETVLAACREEPVVLVLEDVHAASAADMGLIGQLVAASDDARLLLLITLRDTELGRAPMLQKLVRQLRQLPFARLISLQPFDTATTAELARALRDDDIPDEAVIALHSRSGGNPLFATELLAANSLSPLPQSVQDVVLEETERLSPEAQAALSAVAAIGLEFDLWTAARVAGQSEEAVLDALDEAVVARVIRELPRHAGRYEFRHALIRETLYNSLTATRRAHLHRRIVEALERGAKVDDPAMRTIVEHLEHAGELVSPLQLADYTARAGHVADEQRAYDDAAAL